MDSTDLLPRSGEGTGSALRDLLNRSVIYETAGAIIPRDLLQFGLFGSVVVIVTGLMALIIPSAQSIEAGGFFLVLGGFEADLVSLLHALAVPAIFGGLALLGLDLWLLDQRRSEGWRAAVVAQAAAGGVGGVLGTLFLALFLLNLAIWVAIMALVLAMIGMVLGGMAGG